MRTRTRLFTSALVAGALVTPLVPTAPAGAVSTPAIDSAVAWLATQQQADGGFEVAGFPGFESSDAVFALASAGQADASWSEAEALAAVEAVTTDGETPRDALDAVDDWVDSVQGDAGASTATRAQQAAKVVVLVTEPLGLDATDFDPSGDTDGAVDLVAALGAGAGTGDYAGLAFGGRVFATWALGALGQTVPAALVAGLGAAQHPDGGFDFTGDPGGEGFDPDLTAAVVIALTQAGVPATDAVVQDAVLGLGRRQVWTGEWAGGFDTGNPNSTALVMLMAGALGSDPDDACWRNRADARLAGLPYPSPSRAITRRQVADGRITSPNDGFGVNTLATTQAIQALAVAEGATFYAGPGCTYASPSPSTRVAQAYYLDLLDRPTEPGGAAFWAGQFDAGLSPALLAKRFVGTQEYGQVVVGRLVEGYLQRPSTADERADLAVFVRGGARFDLAAILLGSEEYAEVNEALDDDAAWAEALYRDALGRAAGAGDVDYVLDQLEAGTTYVTIARRLLGSAEGRSAFVRDAYRDLLRRNPAGSDLTYWGGELRRGVSPERLVTLIVGSAEYKASTAPPA